MRDDSKAFYLDFNTFSDDNGSLNLEKLFIYEN